MGLLAVADTEATGLCLHGGFALSPCSPTPRRCSGDQLGGVSRGPSAALGTRGLCQGACSWLSGPAREMGTAQVGRKTGTKMSKEQTALCDRRGTELCHFL